jgi:tRNA(Ile)-lysidine synthase
MKDETATVADFHRRLVSAWPPNTWTDVTVLAAVSGGPDSMALLLALHSLQAAGSGRLVAAHFNHRARGEESDADEAFVVEARRKLGIPCEIGRASPGQFADVSGGFEAGARAARYAFLEGAAERLGARYVATGHTADDQAETILHRIIRGTGLAGLAGIHPARPLNSLATLVRPLLTFRRREILEYLSARGQPFREDATNIDPRFTRNRLRHELLPLLETGYNARVVEALLRLGSLAGEAQEVIDAEVGRLFSAAVRTEAGVVCIRCDALANYPSYLVRELLIFAWRSRGWPEQAMSHEKWAELAGLAMPGSPTTRHFPGGIRAERQEELRLSRQEPGIPPPSAPGT